MAFQPSFSSESTDNMDVQQIGMNPNESDMNLWNQITPSIMPWTLQNRPQLVRFGESPTDSEMLGEPSYKLKHQKRKCEMDNNLSLPPPVKVHITEEKMADQLKNMHISSKFLENKGFLGGGSDYCSLPTLSLSDEVKGLRGFNEPLLPDAVMESNNYTKALVLWRPPAGNLPSCLLSSIQTDRDETNENGNNNSTNPDLNPFTTPGFSGSSNEMEM